MKSKGFSYLESSSIHGAKGTMITHSKIESIIYSSLRGLLQCFSFGQVTDFTMFLFHIFFFFLNWGWLLSLCTVHLQKGSRWNSNSRSAEGSSLGIVYVSTIAPGQYKFKPKVSFLIVPHAWEVTFAYA